MKTEDFKFDFIKSTVRAQHPLWTETQVFEQAIVQAKLGSFGRPTVSADAVLIAEAKAGESETDAARATVLAQPPDLLNGSANGGFEKTEAATPKDGQDPRIAKELGKHQQLRETRDQAVPTHVSRLARIRQKMEKDPALTFDNAFSQVCVEEMTPPLLASTVQTRPAAQVEAAPPKSKDLLVTGCFYNLLPGMDEGEE